METHQHDDEFIFRSELPNIYIPSHLPLHSYCFQNLSQFKDRPCLIDGNTGDTFTYADVELTARKVGARLNNLGIEQGHVIMLLLQNCPQFILAFRGATVTTANPFYTPPEVAKQAAASKAKLIITQSSFVNKVKDLDTESGMIKVRCTDETTDFLRFSDLTKADKGRIRR